MATNTQKKAQAHMAARDTRPAAHAKYVRISSRKVKIVIDLIRGKNVDDALAILQYTPKAAAPVVHKLLFQRHRQRGQQQRDGPQGPLRCGNLRQPRPHAQALRCPLPRQRVPRCSSAPATSRVVLDQK